MKILDTHCHLFTPALAETVAANTPFRLLVDPQQKIMSTFLGMRLPLTTEEERLEEMEGEGVDLQVVSIRTAALLDWETLESNPHARIELARVINDYLASLCRKFPHRSSAYADIPLPQTEAATAEMERALDRLRLPGMTLYTNYEGRFLDDPSFQSFFEEADRRHAVIFLHPTHPVGREVLKEHHMYALVGFPYDTTLCVARMIYTGFFDRYPNIRFITSHAGGTIPFLWWRLGMGYRENWFDARTRLQREPAEYLRELYYDTALTDTEQLLYTYQRVGADRLIFGTDHPFSTRGSERTISAVEAMGLPEADRKKIFEENLRELLQL